MEGPSLVILREELQPFEGKVIVGIAGNTKIEKEILKDQVLVSVLSWGKHLILKFSKSAIRIHFLMFGSYRINEEKEGASSRLSLFFEDGMINFYSCSVKFIEGKIESNYNWKTDIMSDKWDEKAAVKKVKKLADSYVCDVLMSQEIFAGVGNIIKNEVLFNVRLHPLSVVKEVPVKLIKSMVVEAHDYSFKFYEWKKIYELRKHWLIYKKRICTRCRVPVVSAPTGKGKRRSYYCNSCQILFE